MIEIFELPIKELAADDCVLFLWATSSLLPEALHTMRDWGFEYKSVAFTWLKRNKKVDTKIQEHSKKPDEVRTRIVELMGDLPRIELFARLKTKGWDIWGNELQNDIDLIGSVEVS